MFSFGFVKFSRILRFCYPVTLYLGGRVLTGGYGAWQFVCGGGLIMLVMVSLFSDYLLVLIAGKVLEGGS